MASFSIKRFQVEAKAERNSGLTLNFFFVRAHLNKREAFFIDAP